MEQHKNVEGECSNSTTNTTLEFQQSFDTTDLLQLRVAHQIAFEDLGVLVRRKDKALSSYSGLNKAWLESENKLLDAVTDYVNLSESLVEQLDLKKRESDNLTKEAYSILTQFEQLTSNGAGTQK